MNVKYLFLIIEEICVCWFNLNLFYRIFYRLPITKQTKSSRKEMNIQNILMGDHSNYLWIFINIIEKIFTASKKNNRIYPSCNKGIQKWKIHLKLSKEFEKALFDSNFIISTVKTLKWYMTDKFLVKWRIFARLANNFKNYSVLSFFTKHNKD